METPVSNYFTWESPSSLEGIERRDPDLSDDEGLFPEQPAFTGLFPPTIFKSLLFKAVNAAQLGPSSVRDASFASSHDRNNPLFLELTKLMEAIPTPHLFLDVLQCQWTSPHSALAPSSVDR